MAEYKINTELNGIEIYFQQKPESKTIDQLKAEGWRWHNSKRCWYNRRNDTTLSFAQRICGESELGELSQIITDLKCIRLKDRLKKEYQSLWKKDYDNYSFDQLTELEKQFELEKKKEVYYSIPTEYISYHNLFYFMWSPDSISLSELESIKIDSDIYLAKKEEIVQNIDKKSKELYLEECADVLSSRKLKASGSNGTSKSIHYCKVCGIPIISQSPYCYFCNPYKDLFSELQKMGTNTGAFNKYAAQFAPYMRPVGVSKDDHRRFIEKLEKNKHVMPDDEIYIPDTRQAASEDEKTYTEEQIIVLNKHNRRAIKLMRVYTPEVIGKYEKAFFDLAVSMAICNKIGACEDYINAYVLEHYRQNT